VAQARSKQTTSSRGQPRTRSNSPTKPVAAITGTSTKNQSGRIAARLVYKYGTSGWSCREQGRGAVEGYDFSNTDYYYRDTA
jgi:hypothetical protein